ncbi:MAG: Myo-inositol 2-dehydrogenase [Gemmataceae bacterium]|nr:Myo-inositol 2-dehydrogenase [Gemmataceae bacterium]
MTATTRLFLAAAFAAAGPAAVAADPHKPLALHPDNPHYFLFRGKPAVLVASGEHYGAVLNREFDYVKYLDELGAHGLNVTRLFTGVYAEDAKAFGITRNTLAPVAGQLLCPWARSDTPGYPGGGNKFDLTKWDPAYFDRLKDFLTRAGERGVVVELAIFCPFYDDSMWKLSPVNAANNVNGIGGVARDAAYNREKNGGLQGIQEGLVRKLADELNGFDNLYYEVCNEPYFGGVTDDWQRRIVDVIVAAEKPLPNKHLIAQNVANGSKKVDKPPPAVSIFNFHYASPPDAVTVNYGLNKVIGENETGFKGTADTHYRMEGWEFLLAGGGLYNNLDYSFVVGHEAGSFVYPEKSPGGGNRGFRQQMKVLKDFLHGFEFVRMKPDTGVVKGGLAPKGRARVLSEPGKQYAVYLFGGPEAKLSLALPAGKYKAEWVSPLTGKVLKAESVTAAGPTTELVSPKFETDIALRVVAE